MKKAKIAHLRLMVAQLAQAMRTTQFLDACLYCLVSHYLLCHLLIFHLTASPEALSSGELTEEEMEAAGSGRLIRASIVDITHT